MTKLYTSALFAAVAAVALMGGCQKDKECGNQDAAAATSGGEAKAGEAGCCSKDAKAAEGACSKDAKAAEGACSKDAKAAEGACQGAKDANAGTTGCGAKDGKACTKEKSACCGASHCSGTTEKTGN